MNRYFAVPKGWYEYEPDTWPSQPQQPMTAQPAAPVGYPDPMAPAPMMPGAPAASAPQYEPPAATVSTFGGPDGSGGQ